MNIVPVKMITMYFTHVKLGMRESWSENKYIKPRKFIPYIYNRKDFNGKTLGI